MSDALDVEHINPITYKAMQVTAEYLQPLFGLIEAGKAAHLFKGEPTPVDLEDGSVGWQIVFRYDDARPAQTAHPGYWIFVSSELDIEVLDPPAAVTRFHKDVPFEWSGTTIPPIATALPDGTAQLRFHQPRSINGPWSYTVTCTDTLDNSLFTVELAPGDITHIAPVRDSTERVIGADVVCVLPTALTPGRSYAFSVEATATSYGTTAVTPASDTITASAGG